MENTAKKEAIREDRIAEKLAEYAGIAGLPIEMVRADEAIMSMIQKVADKELAEQEEATKRLADLKAKLQADLGAPGLPTSQKAEPKEPFRLHLAPKEPVVEPAKIVAKPAVVAAPMGESKLVRMGRQYPGQFPDLLWLADQDAWLALRGILLWRFIPLKKTLDTSHELVVAGQASLDLIHKVLEKIFDLDRDGIKAGRASDMRRCEVEAAIEKFDGSGLAWYQEAKQYRPDSKKPRTKTEPSQAKVKAPSPDSEAKKAYEVDAKALLVKANESYAEKNRLNCDTIEKMARKTTQKGFPSGLSVVDSLKERAIGVFMIDGDQSDTFRVYAKAAGLTQRDLKAEVEARRKAQAKKDREAVAKEQAKRQAPGWGQIKAQSPKKKGGNDKRGKKGKNKGN